MSHDLLSKAAISACSLSDLTKGEPWRMSLPHAHDAGLLIWLSRGEGRVMLGGRQSGLAPGMVCVLPEKSLVAVSVSPRAHGIVVRVGRPAWRPLPNRSVLLRVSPTDLTLPREPGADINGALIASIAQHAKARVAKSESASERLLRGFFERVTLPRPAEFSMASHAEALGVTPTHLTRVCRSTLGMSAADVITGRVLHAARSALADTDIPIKDIAQDTGFSSAAYFTRFIQKHTGLTPSSLRKASALAA